MKKYLKLFSLLLVSVLLVSALSSCGYKSKFCGTWVELDSDGNEETGDNLVLAKDGTGSIVDDGISGSVQWSVDNDKLFMTCSICGMTQTLEFTYEFDGDKMILTEKDGDVTVYRKS